MKTIIALAFLISSISFADTYVHGYVKSNGTYVQPYHRTTADSTLMNNYSTEGNINPYTGKQGTVNPYGNSTLSNQANKASHSGFGSYGNETNTQSEE